MTATLIGVGVGPGDPSLLTIAGRDALLAADAIVVPVAEVSTDGQPGYAERVVRAHVPHATAITRVPFALEDPERRASWVAAAERIVAALGTDGTVAFATIGDPNVYSTFSQLVREVRALAPEVQIRTVPGITAMQDLASRSGTVLLEHDERLTLLPITAGTEHVAAALADSDTVVLYKGGRRLPEVRRVIAEAGRLGDAVFGARLGLPDETVADAVPDAPAPYLSTVLIVPDRETRP
ncbi:precorrin-2 C(20)-methyltransferase [Nitriliruptor alkaliphilus]|uniref:precorrin-2 C(20)-methyltransferase n=1 Tax=Nitriliruptor alkaliphilus TaxID=427918 RepID=UPI0006965CA7|nr:precorrin-2 C(20)-methyltransferase [Nitriliruptor alkaliphilus]